MDHPIEIFLLKSPVYSPKNAEEPRKKLIDFSKSSQASKITPLERLHLTAALKLSEEDYLGAMQTFENILSKERIRKRIESI